METNQSSTRSTGISKKLPGPRLSALPTPTAKTTQKKRSKSLGGPALEKLRANNLTDTLTFELTPRKKARRSLLPGKSILKSRPTLTGLERTTSDTTLTSTLNVLNQLPSRATSTGPEVPAHSSQLTNQSESNDITSSTQPPLLDPLPEDPTTNFESNPPDNSSDMDLSDDQGLHAGSNTTNLLRRVSFAAKAHVRTFGSPILDPDCSTASSNASNLPNLPPYASSSLPDDNNLSEGEQTADMSMENNSLSNLQIVQPAPSVARLPLSKEQLKAQKSSRLSTAIAGFGSYDDDDEEEEEEEEEEDGNVRPNKDPVVQKDVLEPPSAKESQLVDFQSSNKTSQTNPSGVQGDPEQSQDMDITTPFQPIPTNMIHTQSQQRSTNPTVQRAVNSLTQTGIPRLQSLSTNDQQRRAVFNKSSRLSSVLPDYFREHHPADETENLDATSASNLYPPIQPLTTTTSIPSIKPQLIVNDQDHHPTQKLSRLSLAFPEYMNGDDTQEASSIQPPVTRNESHNQLTVQPSSGLNNHSNQTSTSQDQELNNNKQNKRTKPSSRITNFLGVSDEDDDDDDDGIASENPPHQVDQATHPVNNNKKLADHSAQNMAKKPSRLTELFSDWGDLSRELDNAGDINDQVPPQTSQVTSEPASKKQRSRISEFLQPAEDSAEDMDEGNLTLIDFEDEQVEPNSNLMNKRSSMSIPDLHSNLQENEDLMNISFEYSSHVEGAIASRISNSTPGGALPDSQSTFRVDNFPNSKLSVEPRRSSIRNFVQQQIISASPSRRLSGSLPGAALKKSRPSFASPRRSSTVPVALYSNPSNSQIDRHGSLPASGPMDDIGSSLTQEINSTNSRPITSRELSVAHDSTAVATTTTITTTTTSAAATTTVQSSQQLISPKPAMISLNEFFEQAEIKFISLSQPRVRNHDQQHDDLHTLNSFPPSLCFSDQIFAGMVKIPRLRLLESSSRILKQKTEILDLATKEHENLIEKNSSRYKILKEWMNLQERKRIFEQEKKKTTQGQVNENQKDLDELNGLMNRLRLRKNLVELDAKQDSLRFEIDMWKTYQAHLHLRTAKLNQDLDMMRKMEQIVKPKTDSFRDQKQNLTKSILARKQKIAEIESCDQSKLKALKAEAQELLTETEANRRALAESEFEKNLWLGKFSELEQEKVEHVKRIEEMKLDPNQTQKLTVQELVQLKNEFEILQSLMGWELVRYDDKTMEFDFLHRIRVVFHLDPLKPDQHLNVGKIDLHWIRSPPDSDHLVGCQVDHHHLSQKYRIEDFFFNHLKAHYHAKRLSGRVKDHVQEISSIWNHARELTYEIMNVSKRFRMSITQEAPNRSSSSSASKMKVTVMIRSRSKLTCVDACFAFDGQEILDWKSSSPVAHLSCSVSCAFGSADCLNLGYIVSESLDKGNRGALKDACLEVLNSLDS